VYEFVCIKFDTHCIELIRWESIRIGGDILLLEKEVSYLIRLHNFSFSLPFVARELPMGMAQEIKES
jgi:hypothetical protein